MGKIPHVFDKDYIQSIVSTRKENRDVNVFEFKENLFNMLYEHKDDPEIKKALVTLIGDLISFPSSSLK